MLQPKDQRRLGAKGSLPIINGKNLPKINSTIFMTHIIRYKIGLRRQTLLISCQDTAMFHCKLLQTDVFHFT